MNKKIVVYSSNYGSTRRYAQWIAEELSCPLFEKKPSIRKISQIPRRSSMAAASTQAA